MFVRRLKGLAVLSALLVTASTVFIGGGSAHAGAPDPLAGASMQARNSLDAVIGAQAFVTAATNTAAVADVLAARSDVLVATAAVVTSARTTASPATGGTQAAVNSLAASTVVLNEERVSVAAEHGSLGDTDAQVAMTLTALGAAQASYTVDLGRVAQIVSERTGVDPARLMTAWQNTTPIRAYVILSAMAQAGDPYRYASAGPDRFDCSGLTAWSWEQAGVMLTHQSAAQERATTDVSWAQAQVGDLVFTRGGSGRGRVHHVELWLGVDQLAIGSPQPGEHVRVTANPPRIDVIGQVVTPEGWRS